MASKREYENITTLGKLQLKFRECKLKLNAKIAEVKELQEKNKNLKKKIAKLDDLTFAKNKSDMQVAAMEEKRQVR